MMLSQQFCIGGRVSNGIAVDMIVVVLGYSGEELLTRFRRSLCEGRCRWGSIETIYICSNGHGGGVVQLWSDSVDALCVGRVRGAV